jgi:glycosyltransferase involved in cell wall biosynthesis
LPRHYFRTAPRRNAPTISLVTPSYNQGHLLESTLRSVLDQNYPALEYIVQDGGSTDATCEILETYRSRLAYVDSTRDDGQAHALNRGFSRATGDILAYLNSDDLLLPGALAFVADYFARHPEVDVVYGHRVIVDTEGREVGRWVLPPHCESVLGWADFIPQETLFWRRSIWERTGGSMDESFRFALDWDLLLRFRQAGARMVRLPRFLGAFRIHEAQKTHRQLATIGAREIARLRRRTQGREVTETEIRNGVIDYLLRHVWYQRLHELGLLRH